MRTLLPFFLLLALAACGTPAVGGAYVQDAKGQFDDVKLVFGKPDVKAGSDTAADESATDAAIDAAQDAKTEVGDAAIADVVHTDVAPPDSAVDAAPDVPDVAIDAPGTDAVSDSGTKPDIPGCVPKPETCNGIDDNCNGLTDETCDDGEPCTVNDNCSSGDCAGTLMNCSDGNACTADTCMGGTCNHPVYPCNDNNPCTADNCDPASGCVHPPLTTACDDGNPCTTGDNCGSGVCAGTPNTCDDANPCTTDACVGATGCTHTNNSASCDDGNPCTPNDACSAGACVGSGGLCDDGNACTDDSCAGGVCAHTNNTAACSAGGGCTTGDACSAGSCVAGTPKNCDDGLACTTDACAAGACTHSDTCATGTKCDPATNACITAGCAFPTNACANGSQTRYGCDGARVIGRSVAMNGGFKISDTTCDSSDNIDFWSKCYDSAYDHTYRIFLRGGEAISINYSGYMDTWCGSAMGGDSITPYWVVIQSTAGCGEPNSGSCPAKSSCKNNSSTTYTAPAEGWYLIVADGEAWGGAEGVQYDLTVKLNAATCKVPGCECP